MEVAKPIIRKIDDTPESLKIFEEDLCSCSDENVQENILACDEELRKALLAAVE